MFKKIALSFLLCLSLTNLTFAGFASTSGSVEQVTVQLWSTDIACIQVDSKWFKLDLSTKEGNAAYSMALAAKMGGKDMTVTWYDDNNFEGGCDTGTTMNKIYRIFF